MVLEGLLGSLFGGIFRMAPEVLKYLDRGNERKHELEILDRQLESEKLRGAQKLEEQYVDYSTAQLNAIGEAFKQQGEADAKAWKWVASMSALVRPGVTYALFGLYVFGKVVILTAANVTWDQLVSKAWTTEDFAMLNMILTFWFVGRTIEKPTK